MHFVVEFDNTSNDLNDKAIATERFREVFEIYVEDKIDELDKNPSENLNKECRHFNYFIDDIKDEFLTSPLISLPTELRKVLWESEVDKKLPDLMARSTHNKCLRTEHNFDKNYREIIKILEDYCEDRTTKLRDLEATKYVDQDCINFNNWVYSWEYEIKKRMTKLDIEKIKRHLEKTKFKCNINDLDNLDTFFSHVHPRDIKGIEKDPRNSQEEEEEKDEYQDLNSTVEEGDGTVDRKNIPSIETRQETHHETPEETHQETTVVREDPIRITTHGGDHHARSPPTIVRNDEGINNQGHAVSSTDKKSRRGEPNKDRGPHRTKFRTPKVSETPGRKKSKSAKGNNERTHEKGKSSYNKNRNTNSQINKYAHPNHKYTIFECNDLDCTSLKPKDIISPYGEYGVTDSIEIVDTGEGVHRDHNNYCFGDKCKLGNAIQEYVDGSLSPSKRKRKKGKGVGRHRGNKSGDKSSSNGESIHSYVIPEHNREEKESESYNISEISVEEEAARCPEGDETCIDPTKENFIIDGDRVRHTSINDLPEMEALTNHHSAEDTYEITPSGGTHIKDEGRLYDFIIEPARYTFGGSDVFIHEEPVTEDPHLSHGEVLITPTGEVYRAPSTENEIEVFGSPIPHQHFSRMYPLNTITTLEGTSQKPSTIESLMSLIGNFFNTIKSPAITRRSVNPHFEISESSAITASTTPLHQITLDIQPHGGNLVMGRLGEDTPFESLAQAKQEGSSSGSESPSRSFNLGSRNVSPILKTQVGGTYAVLGGHKAKVPKGIEHYITSVPVALAVFGVLFVFILFNKINPFGTFSSKRKKRKVRRRRYDEKILKREEEECFENLIEHSNGWIDKERHDILPKSLYNIEKKERSLHKVFDEKEYAFIDEALNEEDIKNINKYKIKNGHEKSISIDNVKNESEIENLIKLHLDAIEECSNDEWEEYKSEFLEICIEEFFKEQKIDGQEEMMGKKYKYEDNINSIDILKKKKLMWNKWIERNRYIMNNWKDEEWFHNIKSKWENEIEEYFKLEKYDKNVLEIFEKNRENNKSFMIEILKIIWKKWIEKNVKYINKSVTNEWTHKLVIQYKMDYIDRKKDYIRLLKDIYDDMSIDNYNNNYYNNIEYLNNENLIKIMFIQIYMLVLEEYKKEHFIQNISTFLDICLDDIKDKKTKSDEINNMLKLISKMKNKYILKKDKEKEIINEFKNEIFFKNIMCDWKNCEDKFINDHFLEDEINIHNMKKDIPVKHWNHIYHKWLHEENKKDDILVTFKSKEKGNEQNVIDESLLVTKKKNKWKTIIEIYMEVMNECKRDEWEEHRGDFLQICLEEFIKKDNDKMRNINEELYIEKSDYMEDMLMLERQKIIWLQWIIKRNKYMLEKWNKEEWFHKLKKDWENEKNRYDQKLFPYENNKSDKCINPMLERQKYIWRKWIAKHLYHIDEWENEEWFKLLMSKYEKDKDNLKRYTNNKMDDMEKKKLITKLFIEIHMMVIEDFKKEEFYMNKQTFVDTYINELKKNQNSEQNKYMINILNDIQNDIQLGNHNKNLKVWKQEKWFDNLKKEWKEGESKNLVHIEKENFDKMQVHLINNYILEIQKAILKNYWEDMQIKWIDDDNKTDWLKIAINLNDYDNNEFRKNIKFEQTKNNFKEEIEMIKKINKKVQSKDNENDILWKAVIEIHMKIIEEDKKQEWEKNKADFLEICMQEFLNENQNSHKENSNLVNDYMVQENYMIQENHMIKGQNGIWNKCIERNRYILEKWKKDEWFEKLKNEWKNEQNMYINKRGVYSNITDETNVKKINPLIESEKALWKKWLINQKGLLEKYNEEHWFKKLVQDYEKEVENDDDGYDYDDDDDGYDYDDDDGYDYDDDDNHHMNAYEQGKHTQDLITLNKIRDQSSEKYRNNKLITTMWIEIYMMILEECKKEEVQLNKELFLDSCIKELIKENKSKGKCKMLEIVLDLKDKRVLINKNLETNKRKGKNSNNLFENIKSEVKKNENNYIYEMMLKNDMNESGKMHENDCICDEMLINNMNKSGNIGKNDNIIEDNLKNNMKKLGNVIEKCIPEMERNISMRHWENIKKNCIRGKEKGKNMENVENIGNFKYIENIEKFGNFKYIENMENIGTFKYIENIENIGNFTYNENIQNVDDILEEKYKCFSVEPYEEINYEKQNKIFNRSNFQNNKIISDLIDNEEGKDEKKSDNQNEEIWYNGLTLEEIYKNSYTRNSIEYIPYIDEEEYSSLDELDKKNNEFERDDIFYKGLTLEEIYKNAYTRNSIEYIPYIDEEAYSSMYEFDKNYNKRKI